jgi:Na+/H+ antiporter NhaD/arsenite permease-like protein
VVKSNTLDTSLIIFAATYLIIALGQPPLFRIDRTGAAIIGASLMIVFNVLDIETAYRAVNYETIALLFGMMIVVANLRLSGFFHLVSSFVTQRIQTPSMLLYSLILVAGILSAFFINDTVCLVFTPFVLGLTKRMRLNPVPYLLALCMAANIGSVAAITGNPQNIIIGTFSQIPYSRFAVKMFPIALAGLILCAVLIRFLYRKDFHRDKVSSDPERTKVHRPLMIKSLAVSIIMIALFFLDIPMPTVAVGAASYLLITRRVKPEKIYNAIDWRLLILFIGLFIVVKGFEHSGLAMKALDAIGEKTVGHPLFLSASSMLLSNVVSNVPAVMLLKPVIAAMPEQEKAWLMLAMSSTLAGNFTLLGSMANLIVIEGAKPAVKLGLLEYMKVGAPLTLLSLGFGIVWLNLVG